MYRLRFAASLLVAGLLTGGVLMGEDKKSDKEPIVVTKRLPPYYNKLSLTPKQKKDIYRIQANYAAKIQELQEQIAALRTKQKADLKNVLTPAQKALLQEIIAGAKEKDVEDVKEKTTKGKPTEIKKP